MRVINGPVAPPSGSDEYRSVAAERGACVVCSGGVGQEIVSSRTGNSKWSCGVTHCYVPVPFSPLGLPGGELEQWSSLGSVQLVPWPREGVSCRVKGCCVVG